jgi:hypothetical protein
MIRDTYYHVTLISIFLLVTVQGTYTFGINRPSVTYLCANPKRTEPESELIRTRTRTEQNPNRTDPDSLQ